MSSLKNCRNCPNIGSCTWGDTSKLEISKAKELERGPPYCRRAVRKRLKTIIRKFVLVGLHRAGRVEHIYQPVLSSFADIAQFARMIGVRGVIERKRRLRYLRDKALRAAIDAVERAARLQSTLSKLTAAAGPLFDEQRAMEGKPDYCKGGRCTVPFGEKLLTCRGFKARDSTSVTCKWWRLDIGEEPDEFCDRKGG